MKRSYTWWDLEELLELGYAQVSGAVERAPRRWRRALALALAVAKWAPGRERRGFGTCGLCEYYRGQDRPCRRCLLRQHWGRRCSEGGSPWQIWNGADRGTQAHRMAADRVHRDLVILYTAELRRLGWL